MVQADSSIMSVFTDRSDLAPVGVGHSERHARGHHGSSPHVHPLVHARIRGPETMHTK